MEFVYDRLTNTHYRVIFKNINESDKYKSENEQAKQIITNLGKMPQFQGIESVSPSSIIEGFAKKDQLHKFCKVTCNIWMPQQSALE